MPGTHQPSSLSLRAFTPAWLAAERTAREFLPAGFENRRERIEIARHASSRRAAGALVDVLAFQHRDLAGSPARDRSLSMLAAGGAATVVAGQQVGLFTGPAFAVYKAAGVVACAKRLAEESGVPCVPVFWLPTEDHDWREIDHCVVRGAGGHPRRISVADNAASERIPVADRTFDQSIEPALENLAAAVAAHPFADEVVALFRRHYRCGISPASAFRAVLAELFAGEGLLFVDPRAANVAALARPLYERSLREAAALSACLEQRAVAMAAAGFHVQVPVRPGAPLAFFHPDGPSGPRYRLEPRGEEWRLCDTDRSVARDETMRVLGDDPMCFSSSALLRPLVQDFLLPNAMTLGGPGEIAYFAQLGPLYHALGVEMPLVAPRPSFCVTSAGDRRRLETLGLVFADIAGDRDKLLARLSRFHGEAFPPDDVERELTKDFVATLERFAAHATALDENLARPIGRTRAAVEHAVAQLAARYRRSVLERDTVLVRRVDRLRDALAPDGVPQERCYGLASLAAEHGIAGLLAAIDRAIEPFDARTRELAL